jgi:hypothetical protein
LLFAFAVSALAAIEQASGNSNSLGNSDVSAHAHGQRGTERVDVLQIQSAIGSRC